MLIRLVRFFLAAPTYAKVSPADLDDARIDADRHRGYQKRIVAVGAAFGILSLVPSGVLVWRMVEEGGFSMDLDILKKVALLTLASAVFSTSVGVAVGCLFAPREFLEGPLGRRWMAFIGPESVAAARVVCLLVVLGLAGVAGFAGLGFVWMSSGPMGPPIKLENRPAGH